MYSPIFAEIVPEKQRTSIYALDRTFESILASFAPPVVGLLSQHLYGFKPDDKGSSPEQDRENAASLAKARQDLDGLRGGGLDQFAGAVGVPPTELDFLAEAYAQVIEGRRVLRWTYAHVYHLDPARDNVEFCEYLQGEAERSLERLHDCAELERNKLRENVAVYAVAYPAGYAAGKFAEFREKLSNLNLVTRNHFSKLVEGFESGMAEVVS